VFPTCVRTAEDGGPTWEIATDVGTMGAGPIGDLEGSVGGSGENVELSSLRADVSDGELGCIVVAEGGLEVGRLVF